MPKLIWEKKLQEAVKRQQLIGWSVLEKRGKVLVQRYYPDINRKTTVALPLALEPNQELSVLNALRNINDCMQNSGCNLKEAFKILYKDSAHKINLDWKKLIEDFKEYKNISKSSLEGNYSYFLNAIKTMMGSPNEPTTGKAILEKLVKNKKEGAGKKRIVSNAKTFLEYNVVKKRLDERFLPNLFIDISETWRNKMSALEGYLNEIREYPHSRSLEDIENLAKLRGSQNVLKMAEEFQIIRKIEFS